MDRLAGLHRGKDWFEPHLSWLSLFIEALLLKHRKSLIALGVLQSCREVLRTLGDPSLMPTLKNGIPGEDSLFRRALICALEGRLSQAISLFQVLSAESDFSGFSKDMGKVLMAFCAISPEGEQEVPSRNRGKGKGDSSVLRWLEPHSGEELDLLGFSVQAWEVLLYEVHRARVFVLEARFRKALDPLRKAARLIEEKDNPRAWSFLLAGRALVYRLMRQEKEAGLLLGDIRKRGALPAQWPISWQNELGFSIGPSTQNEGLMRRQQVFLQSFCHGKMLGNGPSFQVHLKQLKESAPSLLPVLLEGETGTGKELAAEFIHHTSHRSGEFVRINCAALPDSLAESELFGCARGAFTGASERPGFVARAHGGTLFLDEIGSLSTSIQGKLLRLLDSGEYFRLGDSKAQQSEFRLIAATCESAVLSGSGFRKDLLFRLSAHRITLPLLKDRREDLPLLVHHFLMETGRWFSQHPLLEARTLEFLSQQEWAGNIRELRHFVLRLSHHYGEGLLSLLQAEFLEKASGAPTLCVPFNREMSGGTLKVQLRNAERRGILQALALSNHVKSEAAQRLDISLPTLYAKMKRHAMPVRPELAEKIPISPGRTFGSIEVI